MSKQYEFKAPILPYILVLPQMVIVFIFFFWPAAKPSFNPSIYRIHSAAG
jgi:hypothetical protein